MSEKEDLHEAQIEQFLQDCIDDPSILDLGDCVIVPEHVTTAEEFCEWIEEQDVE